MKTLELKHLAPYLPYDLTLVKSRGYYGLLVFDKLQFNNKDGYIPTTLLECLRHGAKPILRPRSDWGEYIEFRGERVIPYRWLLNNAPINMMQSDVNMLCKMIENIFQHLDQAPYWVVQILLEMHIDVFELIDAGLAVDVNTLN